MTIQEEETLEYYKQMTVHPSGISKDKIPHKAELTLTDAAIEAFYSERYADVDVAEFLKNERKERLLGLCNMVKAREFFLDVGCADGGHMDVLYQRDIHGIGLDLAVTNILRGREKYPHLKFIHGFAEEIPFSDNYFDVILLGDVIELFRNPQAVLSECLRVAKTGLVICVPIKQEITEEHINPFNVEKIHTLLNLFKLKITYYNFQGETITKDTAVLALKDFPWFLIRAEKSEGTDTEVKLYRATYTSEIETSGKRELLDNDQWKQGNFHSRDPSELARFNLVSHLVEGNSVLEIGAGNGDSTLALSKTGCNVIGVDISAAGIKNAQEYSQNQNSQNRPTFQVMDATALAFPDNTFDTVIIPEVLEHVKSSRKILQEAIRVVRNGGRIVFSVPDGLLVPWKGHLRVFFKDTLTTELSQYTDSISWHDLPFKKWIIGSFFVKKTPAGVKTGSMVDIIMPTYNGKLTIERAIRSVIDQTYQNWNLIVVNDGGVDVGEIIEKFQDARIKYLSSEHRGKSHALNTGIQNSDNEYISYLDDDDILYPLHLEELIQGVQKSGAEFVYADWYEVSYNNQNTEFKRELEFRLDVTPAMLITQNYINHKCILHSRKLLRETGGYDEELSLLIDWDMIRRLAFKATPLHIWSLTSERIRYYDNDQLTNRITGLWERDKDKSLESVKKIIEKTDLLGATAQNLTYAVEQSMMTISYYNYPFVHELQLNLLKKNEVVQSLQFGLSVKDQQIQEITDQLDSVIQTVTAKDQQIQEITDQLDSVIQTVTAKDQQIQEITNKLDSVIQTVTAKDQLIQDLSLQIVALNQRIFSIENSIVWQFTMKFHSKIIERLLPQNTRRRKYYDLGLKGGRILVNEGVLSFHWKLREYQRQKKPFTITGCIEPLPALADVSDNDNLNPVSKKVSIVIPTKNAGDDFSYTLEKIKNQKGIQNIELIIVDSGSTDNTLAIAEEYGAKVMKIAPEEFNHGETRNFGASQANGDYILFIVQDAIPITDKWLFNIVNVIESDLNIAAVSCRQIPRSDSDLFAQFCINNHYRTLNFLGDFIVDIGKIEFSGLTGNMKRNLAGLDNVCTCFKKEIFLKFKFNPLNFAEDLDIGIRLIEGGYKLEYLYSVGVIHSHNRSAGYNLKRFYVDRKSLIKMFDEKPPATDSNVDAAVSAMIQLYEVVKYAISKSKDCNSELVLIPQFYSNLKQEMTAINEKIHLDFEGNKELDDLMMRIDKNIERIFISNNYLYPAFFDIIDNFTAYAISISPVQKKKDLVMTTYNLFTIVSANYLGNIYFNSGDNAKIQKINNILSGGI